MRSAVGILSLLLGLGVGEPSEAPTREPDQPAVEGASERAAIASRARAAREQAEQKASRKKGERVYLGPLGLMWGESPSEVLALLDGRLTFQKQFTGDNGVSVVQRYQGEFAGYRTELVDATFWNDKLLGVAVVLAEPDPRPAHRRWAGAVDAMTREYGQPSKISRPPVIPALKMAREAKKQPEMRRSASLLELMASGQEDEFLLGEILTDRWQPVAVWRFKNAIVSIAVQAKEPDENGFRALRVSWLFGEWPRFEEWRRAAHRAGKKDRDF